MESAEPSLRRSRQWRRSVGRESWITESTRNFDSDLTHQSNDLVFGTCWRKEISYSVVPPSRK